MAGSCMLHRLPLAVVMAVFASVATASAQPARWTIDAAPTVRLGASDAPDAILSAPAGATRLPNGNIVVGDVAAFALREFSPQGALVKKYARKGSGPGEVTYLAPLLRCGDTLVAHDIAGMDSKFRLDGTFISAFRLKPQPYRLSCNARGQFIVMGWSREHNAGVSRPNVTYSLARADTSAGSALAELPGGDRMGIPGGEGPYPLGREPFIAIGSTRAYVALADSLEVRVFDLTGKPLPSLVAPFTRTNATKADLDADMERTIAMMGESRRKMIERDYANVPLAPYLPATRALLLDAEENVWVQHYPRAASNTVQWTVFGSNGRVRATLQLPTALDVYEIGRDYVLGRYIDPDESVPEVRLYKLNRR